MTVQPAEPSFNKDWFTRHTKNFTKHLSHLAQRESHAIEIGTYEGRCALWLLNNILTHSASTITCIDHTPHESCRRNLSVSSKVRMWEAPSRDILPSLPKNSFDFIYIDGSHKTINVLEDAVLSFGLMKVGAVIAFDDYRWNDPQFAKDGGVPKPAIDCFARVYKSKLRALTWRSNYQRWFVKTAALDD